MWLDVVHLSHIYSLEEGLDLKALIVSTWLSRSSLAQVVYLLEDREKRMHPRVARREDARVLGLLQNPAYECHRKQTVPCLRSLDQDLLEVQMHTSDRFILRDGEAAKESAEADKIAFDDSSRTLRHRRHLQESLFVHDHALLEEHCSL